MKTIEQAPELAKIDNEKVLQLFTSENGQKLIRDINEKYHYWDKVKYYESKDPGDASLLWAAVKLSRAIHSKRLSFGKHTFSYYLTDAIQESLHQFDLNFGGQLGSKGLIPEEDKGRYLISSIMEEAIASSQIEGAVTTRKKAKEMLRKNLKPTSKSEQMIVNNYRTIQFILEHKDEPISKARLLEIHRLVSHRTLDDPADEGRYRDNNDVAVMDVLDGETVFSPPHLEELEVLMTELFRFFNAHEEGRFVHPIIKGCIIHFMIGYIHPFVDGNGRTARALFYWYMLKNGYWLTEYLSISRLIVKSKTQYAQAFLYTETDQNDLSYFIQYKMKTLRLAFESLQEYITRKIAEKRQLLSYHAIPGLNERQAQILKWVAEEGNLLLTIKEVETRFNVSNQSVRNDLQDLVARGFLKVIPLNKKLKGFGKSEQFDGLLAAYTAPRN